MDLYSEIILDYYKNPRNKFIPQPFTHSGTEYNPSCGDKISFYLNVDGAGKIQTVGFQGEGCAISQASTSMLTERLEGMNLSDAQNLTSEELIEMLGIEISAGRIKCALLGLEALRTALKNPL